MLPVTDTPDVLGSRINAYAFVGFALAAWAMMLFITWIPPPLAFIISIPMPRGLELSMSSDLRTTLLLAVALVIRGAPSLSLWPMSNPIGLLSNRLLLIVPPGLICAPSDDERAEMLPLKIAGPLGRIPGLFVN